MDKAVFFQPQQKVSGLIGLKMAIELPPFPGFTQLHGNETSPMAVMLADGLVDELDGVGAKISAPITKRNGCFLALWVHNGFITESPI